MRTDYVRGGDLSALKDHLGFQNRLIVEVMEQTGLRVGDVVELATAQIKPCMAVREDKTGKIRTVRLSKATVDAIRAQAGPEWAFPGARGGHKTRQAVWAAVKSAAQEAGINGNVAPHSLRKVYAVRRLARSGDLEEVQRELQHEYPSTTLMYVMGGLEDEELFPEEPPEKA